MAFLKLDQIFNLKTLPMFILQTFVSIVALRTASKFVLPKIGDLMDNGL